MPRLKTENLASEAEINSFKEKCKLYAASQRKLARELRISHIYLNIVLNHKKPVSKKRLSNLNSSLEYLIEQRIKTLQAKK